MEQNNTNTFKFEYGSDEKSPSQRYEREYKEKSEYDLDLEKPIMHNVIYYYYGTPKLCINLGYCNNENDAKKLQTSFQILNYHKNIVIEVSNFIIGDEIICDKLKYPKHYGKKNKIYKKNELFDRIRNKNKVIILKNEIY